MNTNEQPDQPLDETSLAKSFTKTKKKLLRDSLISVGLTFVSLAIVGTQLFYPYHFYIGVGIYVLSFIPFIHRIYLSHESWKQYGAYTFTTKFYKKEKRRLYAGILFMVAILSIITVRPVEDNLFRDMSSVEITTRTTDDLYLAVSAMDYLETTGNTLLTTLRNEAEDTNQTKLLENTMNEFLLAVQLSESLTDTHRYFDSIHYTLTEERDISYIIAYSLYVKKYEIIHQLITEVSLNDYQKTVLNQFSPLLGRTNAYNEMVQNFYKPKTRLRLTAGALLLSTTNEGLKEENSSFAMLTQKSEESYDYLLDNFDKTLTHSAEVSMDTVKENMFETWFPIQKNIANSMGHAIISTRGHDYFITPEQVDEMEEVMEPGDIMLQRRNWHVSNVGIPGFWTHSALYSGSLETMEEYFASEFPYEEYETMSEYLKAELPEVFATLSGEDTDGRVYSVIEAIEPGVVFQSLAKSAHADFVATLRPNLTKSDKLIALITAFENTGKPYDYNFDFTTRDALVCSELVYDAYFEDLPEKAGIHLETSLINGRPITSPLDIAIKYKKELDSDSAELSFVYFIAGSEEDGKAYVSDKETFIESIDWNKFSFMQK